MLPIKSVDALIFSTWPNPRSHQPSMRNQDGILAPSLPLSGWRHVLYSVSVSYFFMSASPLPVLLWRNSQLVLDLRISSDWLQWASALFPRSLHTPLAYLLPSSVFLRRRERKWSLKNFITASDNIPFPSFGLSHALFFCNCHLPNLFACRRLLHTSFSHSPRSTFAASCYRIVCSTVEFVAHFLFLSSSL